MITSNNGEVRIIEHESYDPEYVHFKAQGGHPLAATNNGTMIVMTAIEAREVGIMLIMASERAASAWRKKEGIDLDSP